MKTQNYFRKFLAVAMALGMLFSTMSTAIYAVENEQSLPFADVDRHDWFFDQVQHVFDQGIMAGTDAETFSPNINVTRAMTVQVLYNHAGRPSVFGWSHPFNDVAIDAWYHDAVVWAMFHDIARGFADYTFSPDEYITRAHLTVMLNNYANAFGLALPATRDIVVFADYMDIRNYAKESIDRFFRAMIINGRPDGRFDPHGNTTRAELAAMLSGFVIFSENAINPWNDSGYAVPEYGVFDYDIAMPMYGVYCEPVIQPDYGFFDDHLVPPYGFFDADVVPEYGFFGCED